VPENLRTADYKGGESLLEAFVKTLVCGSIEGVVPAIAGHGLNLKESAEAFDKSVVKGIVDVTTSSYVDMLRYFLSGRAFFTSEKAFMGICPSYAEAGDHIVFILGSAPLVLRSVPGRNDRFRVIGECYVQGLMSLEVFAGSLPDGWRSKTASIDGFDKLVFVDRSGNQTQMDPRLGALPQDWTFKFGSEYPLKDSEIDEKGDLRSMWFVHSDGTLQCQDPRLTSELLKTRGVDIQDFILV